MKSLYTYVIAAFLLFACKSKEKTETVADDLPAIKSMIKNYNDAFRRADWETVLDLIHPDVFKMVTRDNFKKMLQTTFKGDGYEMQFEQMNIDSIHPVVTHNKDKYSLIFMNATSFIKYTEETDSAGISQETLANTCEGMKAEFGKDFISCQPSGNGVRFSIRDRCYAIYLSGKKKWYFLSKDKDSEDMFDKIMPAEVRDKLEN